jgi:hypothetical protein
MRTPTPPKTPDTTAYHALPPADRLMLDTATDPQFGPWLDQIRRIGGCEHPIYLTGSSLTLNPATGEILARLDSAHLPHGRLAIACGNRRASRCVPCSYLHQGDTYHLIVAGLAGGKSLPAEVRTHPRVFATFTAPSFGPVHRATEPARRCRPHHSGVCEHAVPRGCQSGHDSADPLIGTPLCPACYDYPAAVLFNAHTGDLWRYLRRDLDRTIARAVGLHRSTLKNHVRVSFAKVAEYQRRGQIHFHAVIRLDGPEGPADPPPAWGSVELLTLCLRSAAARVRVHVAETAALGEITLRWGRQLDVRPIVFDSGPDVELTERAVASYIAKYVTKGHLPGVTVDSRIRHASAIDALNVTDHVRTLIRTCWRLGALPELEPRGLRRWAHQLGYAGHVTTKSRAYSTTYTALRESRAAHRRAETGTSTTDAPADALTASRWSFSGSGYTPGQAMFAASITEHVTESRQAAREHRTGEQ